MTIGNQAIIKASQPKLAGREKGGSPKFISWLVARERVLKMNTIMAEKFIEHVDQGRTEVASDACIVALLTAHLSGNRNLIERVLAAKEKLDNFLEELAR